MIKSKYGYAGNILRVDLSNSGFQTEVTENYAPQFLGGRGINQWILLNELKPAVSPFDASNIIAFGAGALVGTLVPGASRLNIDSKNPFTLGIGSSNAGGWFSTELKFAGYDHIIIHGKAKRPSYLWIENDRVTLRPAAAMWGKTTAETEKMIKEDVNQDDIQVLCIGPAGENITRNACIIVSGSRAAGRCGLGAVMGSKNLKAIAVKGTGTIGIKQPDEFMAFVQKVTQRIGNVALYKTLRELGTLSSLPSYNNSAALPYKNFQNDSVPEESFSKISTHVFHDMCDVQRYACAACPVPCGHIYTINQGQYAGTQCLKAEANAVWDFGARVGLDNAGAILKAQEQCTQLGLDIDNTASTIGWAIDCFQNKIITESDTEGLKLTWGDEGVILELIRKIAYREGIGNILAEGSLRASRIVGKDSQKYSFHLKGQDLVEGIRSMKGWALGVVVSARGGTHTRGAPTTEFRPVSEEVSQSIFGVKTAFSPRTYSGKATIVKYFECVHSLLDSFGVCSFVGNWSSTEGITPKELAKFYSLLTGIQLSESELMQAGERIHNVEKMFNVYHAGFTRKHDYPPERLMKEPIKSGPSKGELLKKEDWDKMLDEYYSLHGWDPSTSWPTKNRLKEIGLHECIEKLEQAEKTTRGKDSWKKISIMKGG